ncbi:hypothetical protein ABRZ00_12965 [Castellaniella ginsengisoli]|uniref:Uncharacterized protein n=1 Tax=Castellaniella ginsengisoli TaxID=546114 RepID=A0AB39DNP2_9BURK
MTIDTQKLLNLFDTAAQAHGWASDQGTRAQAQTALANYQRTRGDLEQALDAQAAEIARLREVLTAIEQWEIPLVESRGEAVPMSVAYGSNGVRDYFRGVARAALKPEGDPK